MNSIVLTGRLTADPEIRTTPSGKQVAAFTIATDRKFTDGTDFIPCRAWNKTAEFVCKWFNKGKMIAATGSLRADRVDKDGQTRTYYHVAVDSVEFCGGKNEDGGARDVQIMPSYNEPQVAPDVMPSYDKPRPAPGELVTPGINVPQAPDGFVDIDADEEDLPF